MACNTPFRLGLPVDIPWQKVCVTEDMMDRVVCDDRLPPKWHSSIAVFKYVPEEEYQQFPDTKVTFLKVTVTITGYQPMDDEIQGEIDWDGLNVTTVEGLTDLLSSYYPCHGAILQVVVGPKGSQPDIPLDKYPYFIDFEPKKREMYEMATDTKERLSRSLETTNLTKSAGTVQSLEVLDIDMGGGGFGMQGQGSYMGTGGGGGFTYQAPNGQWGTKSLNTDQSQVTRTTDNSTEKRESYSFTTQLSQMYHLLNSYHLGTNRAVFFVQPRPHIIEEPSGFVRGPRKVEGIQEFILVVGQPKDQEDFCVSVRLDTSHIIEQDILEYDWKTDVTDLASATARIPTSNDQPAGTRKLRACLPPFGPCWDVNYKCYKTRSEDDVIYQAPDGYIIDSYTDLVNSSEHGSTSVRIDPSRKTLTVHAEAEGHICFEDSGVCLDCPDEIEKTSGYARRQVQVRLRSEERIRKVGTQLQLVVTTRGLCCCDTGPNQSYKPADKVIGVFDIPAPWGGLRVDTPVWNPNTAAYVPELQNVRENQVPNVEMRRLHQGALLSAGQAVGPAVGQAAGYAVGQTAVPISGNIADVSMAVGDCGCGGKRNGQAGRVPVQAQTAQLAQQPQGMLIRQANDMIEFIRDCMIRAFTSTAPSQGKSFIETDLFARQLSSYVVRTRAGRTELGRPVVGRLDEKIAEALSKHLNKSPKEVTVSDVLDMRNEDLAKIAGIELRDVARLKMSLLGVGLKKPGKFLK